MATESQVVQQRVVEMSEKLKNEVKEEAPPFPEDKLKAFEEEIKEFIQ